MRYIVKLFSIFLLLICFSSCTCQRTKNQPKKEKEVKPADIAVKIIRFEKELHACNPETIEQDLDQLSKKHKLFYPIYYNQVLNIPSIGDKSAQMKVMQDLLVNKYSVGLYDTVQYIFPNLKFLEDDLKICLSNYQSYYPEKPIPLIYTCISEFSYSIFTITDSLIGISLDKYLGPKYIYYPSVFQESQFMIPTFDKKYMAIDVANALASNVVAVPNDKSTLLDKMIAEGKMLYFIQSLLPKKSDEDIIKYSEKQYQWCFDNEFQIWTYFITQELLYNTQFEQFKYVKEGPSTYGMPPESPGKVGAWLGWQIVRKYMQENPSTSLRKLIEINDSQKILTGSKYKPTYKN